LYDVVVYSRNTVVDDVVPTAMLMDFMPFKEYLLKATQKKNGKGKACIIRLYNENLYDA